jgi:hypothetical protein
MVPRYVHPRLAAIEHAGSEAKPMRMVVVWGGDEAPTDLAGISTT